MAGLEGFRAVSESNQYESIGGVAGVLDKMDASANGTVLEGMIDQSKTKERSKTSRLKAIGTCKCSG